MGIVQIIRRTNRNVINARSLAPELFAVPVEALEFGEEMCFGEIFIQYAYGIVFVEGG